ncbi:hypothetical protein [Aureimonas sp. Leaf454]|uniref:hypothetical protein n=1 Tax=Aureimonas sp. Leaf454 TaxID=1736381 RepID=UPI0012E3CCD9|nr:hypothetical protein [Aureimonas sp. Leaf454]
MTAEAVGAAGSMDGLGRHVGARLYENEVRYLVAEEWARRPNDVLRLRTQQGLHMSEAEQAAVTPGFAPKGAAAADDAVSP